MSRERRRTFRPKYEQLDDRCLLTVVSPVQMRQAYGLNSTSFTANGQAVAANGAGQVVAIVVAFHDKYLSQDLHTFDATYGLTDPRLTQVNLAGASSDDGW